MAVRNKRPDLNGILNIDKPLGWSSAKVCAKIRWLSGGAKVGHAGTLDPLATGVLVVCLGTATKKISELMDSAKAYRADIDLSAFSATDDAEGEREPVVVERAPNLEEIRAVLDREFTGVIEQRPPRYSAVKIGGRRAYKLARSGEEFETTSKSVRIDGVEIVEYEWPRLVLEIACGKGTYIRSIARDLGVRLGTGGMLTGLVRTRVGRFELGEARSIEGLPSLANEWTADLLSE